MELKYDEIEQIKSLAKSTGKSYLDVKDIYLSAKIKMSKKPKSTGFKEIDLLDLGFIKLNNNTYSFSLEKERFVLVDINVVGSIKDSVYIKQYEDVVYLCCYDDKKKLNDLLWLIK